MEDAEVVGTLRLPLGGMNGYLNVRGRQGRQKDKYQGFTPNTRRAARSSSTLREKLQSPSQRSSSKEKINSMIQSGTSTSRRRR